MLGILEYWAHVPRVILYSIQESNQCDSALVPATHPTHEIRYGIFYLGCVRSSTLFWVGELGMYVGTGAPMGERPWVSLLIWVGEKIAFWI